MLFFSFSGSVIPTFQFHIEKMCIFVYAFVGCDLVDGFGSLHPTVISSFLREITVDRFVVAISDWCTMICGGPLLRL